MAARPFLGLAEGETRAKPPRLTAAVRRPDTGYDARRMRSSDPDLSRDTHPSEQPERKSTRDGAEIGTAPATPEAVDPGARTDSGAPIDPAAPPAAGIPETRRIQHYELIRELGRGGMGVVHLARDLRLGRLVAIKMLTGQDQLQERFLAEARATARCRHENIVVIYEVGIHENQPYMVFEYLRGQTLREWMDARPAGGFEARDTSLANLPAPLAPARAVEMIVPVVRALVCAHDMGIIHRDLKPANILLTEDGVTKVLDFGVAKIGAAREHASNEAAGAPVEPLAVTALGARMGTLPYMSPEQIAGELVDHRSDIWAVGIILYELVTGAHPLAPLSVFKLEMLDDLATPMPSARERRNDLGPLADVIDRCLLKDREHRTATARQLIEELEALLPAQRTRARDEDTNPFAGLGAFQEADADRFFGRNHDITSLLGKLRSLPLVAVTGPSGAGKSSLVRAGVIPALKSSGEGWDAIVTRPGREPLAALAEALLALAGRASAIHPERGPERGLAGVADEAPAERDAILARLRTEPGYLGITLRAWARAKRRRLLLFVDQFEELYTLGAGDEERSRVLACLGAAADDVTSPLRVILSLRSDFLDRLVEQRTFLDAVTQGLTFLAPLDRDSLREALIGPLQACDHRFESPAMVEGILDELEATRSPLPLLQFTADKLWARRDRGQRVLTESSLRALGGVSGALASHAEDTLSRMPAAHRGLVREIFRQLVTADGTRAILTRRELRQILASVSASGEADAVIEELVRARLLVTSDGETDDAHVEVAHEALLSSWPRLVAWQREDAEGVRLRDQLRAAARQWVERGRPRGILWRGDALLEYRVWRSRYRGSLTEDEEAFARASLHDEARRRRRRGIALAAAFAGLALGLVLVLALNSRTARERDRAASLANESRQRLIALYLEQGRQRLADGDALRAFAYLAEARKSGDQSTALGFLLARARHALDGQLLVLRGHEGPIWDARFSPDGTRIATGSSDKTARIWDAATGALLHTLSGFTADVYRVRFSPDGTCVLAASWDGTARVWDVATGALLWTADYEDRVLDAEFGPDGTFAATTGFGNTIALWNTADGRRLRTLVGHTERVIAMELSPDGDHLVTGSEDGTARVWDPATGALLSTSEGHGAAVHALAVSPDSRLAASTSWSGRVRVISLRDGRSLELAGHDDQIHDVAFSPDGTRLVTASEDRTARVWDTATGALLHTLEGHDCGVRRTLFTRDGQSVLTFAIDGTARRWSAATGQLEWTFLGHRDGIWSAQLDPGGERLLTASSDGTVRVWRAQQQRHLRAVRAPGSVLTHASLAPDGQRIAAIDRDGTVRVWDGQGTVTATMEAVYEPHSLPHRVAWSPDGERLLSSGGARVVIWDARTGAQVSEVERGAGNLHASWSRDGARIVTGSHDGTIELRDARTGALLQTLTGHAMHVTWAELDPSGRRVLSASMDLTVRIWDLATGVPLRTLTAHRLLVMSARYSMDGALLITASGDTTARIFTADGDPIQLLEGHTSMVHDAVLGPDNRLAATAGQDGTARVWDRTTGTMLWSVDFGKRPVTSVEFGRDGRSLLLATGDTAAVLDMTADDSPTESLTAFSMCRAGYLVERGRLERVDPDPALCTRQH
jgi:WD40 repeat protein/serine/threonine protein kinase